MVIGFLGALALSALGLELGLRALGYADFPLYRADPVLGYVPKANSSGVFAGNRHWTFNDRGMRMEAKCQPGPDAILLLGDSLVHGGTMVDQHETLGVQIARQTGREVCPLGAGSWALENELSAVLQEPEYLKFGTIVLISNSEDFVKPSIWVSEVTHPTHPPRSVLLFAAEKVFDGMWQWFFPPKKPAASMQWIGHLDKFLASYRGGIFVVLYPKRDEIGSRATDFAPFVHRLGSRATLIEPQVRQGWNSGLYRDTIHPTPAGKKQISTIIAHALAKKAGS